jgi:hypothetical protein
MFRLITLWALVVLSGCGSTGGTDGGATGGGSATGGGVATGGGSATGGGTSTGGGTASGGGAATGCQVTISGALSGTRGCTLSVVGDDVSVVSLIISTPNDHLLTLSSTFTQMRPLSVGTFTGAPWSGVMNVISNDTLAWNQSLGAGTVTSGSFSLDVTAVGTFANSSGMGQHGSLTGVLKPIGHTDPDVNVSVTF